MSSGQLVGRRPNSTRSQSSRPSEKILPPPTPSSQDQLGSPFEPCAATASFFLYAQRNIILCLHHDTLAIERRFEKHKEDILLISVDNVSERGAGRLVVSYDTRQIAIVWDLLTGEEVARFESYEYIRVASWLRDGSIAFGNSQGSIILFEPSTSEHLSTRTIFDPVTALAPASDCRTFAIGYLNGSILIATLQPSFTIIHTLSTSRGPSPITGLAWHGSSSRQKMEMLATQTVEGDLRVWSVSKVPHSEPPRIIRVLGAPSSESTRRSWFAWSKNGRIVQHSDGDTRAWDVRTKRVSHETVPTIDNVVAITSYGPNGTVFTVGRNHSVQQYDLVSQEFPVMVANVQHVPPNAPPTPPDFIEDSKLPRTVPMTTMTSTLSAVPVHVDAESSEEEGLPMSPLQKIAQEMDTLEQEKRDQLAPLSPLSSRGSSLSSTSSYGRRSKNKSKRIPPGPTSDITFFSGASSVQSSHDGASFRSSSSMSSSKFASSSLRHEIMRSPEEAKQTKVMDLFPFTKARLSDVKFRTPHYGQASLTPDVLRREMLSVIFGWDDDIEALIRDEQTRHKAGSASGVLLSKWLGDLGADTMAQMVGSESMTSSDWMLLALCCQMGQGSQKKVGEAFVKRLLETGETHPAVAILLGLGEENEAVEVYVSRKYYMEAVLLTCLIFPNDWQRQSHLVRRWGEAAVSQGQAELAVRCFSCTTIESSEPWFSPRAQDAVYQAQQRSLAPHTLSPPASPPSAVAASRITAKTASLKLITTFGDKGKAKGLHQTTLGVTPIADTALSPNTGGLWPRDHNRGHRDRSQSRTATPGGIGRRRLPSAGPHGRDIGSEGTPLAGARTLSRRATPALSDTGAPRTTVEVLPPSRTEDILAPFSGATERHCQPMRTRNTSKDRNHFGLHIEMIPVVEYSEETARLAVSLSDSQTFDSKAERNEISEPWGRGQAFHTSAYPRSDATRPPDKPLDRYISSFEETEPLTEQQWTHNSMRAESRDGRSRSRARDDMSSDKHGRSGVAYIQHSRRSPSSPVPMTADEARKYSAAENFEDERYYGVASPAGSKSENARGASQSERMKARRDYSEVRSGSPDLRTHLRSGSRPARGTSRSRTRHESPGAKQNRDAEEPVSPKPVELRPRSPPSPISMKIERGTIEGQQARTRQRSSSRTAAESRTGTPSRKVQAREAEVEPDVAQSSSGATILQPNTYAKLPPSSSARTPRSLSRKELAAKELEERRLSLARRPSVPNIPHPEELGGGHLRLSPRSVGGGGTLLSSKSYADGLGFPRSHTVGPDASMRSTLPTSINSAPSTPLGLPATPKVVHEHDSTTDPERYQPSGTPFSPITPDDLAILAPITYEPSSRITEDFGPLLPSTVYSEKPPLLRSFSAPPTDVVGLRRASSVKVERERQRRESFSSRGHARKGSEIDVIPEVSTSFEAGLHNEVDEDHVIIVSGSGAAADPPPVLAELAHLAGPPPPPPPPTMFQPLSPTRTSGMIDIVIEDHINTPLVTTMTPPIHTNSPMMHRRRTSTNEITSPSTPSNSTGGIGGKWRNVTDRMRSSSRNRTKSPPAIHESATPLTHTPAPYETVLTLPATQFQRTKSPQASSDGIAAFGMSSSPPEMGVSSASVGSPGAGLAAGYRNPKEIRANMPPGMLQAGVWRGKEWGMI